MSHQVSHRPVSRRFPVHTDLGRSLDLRKSSQSKNLQLDYFDEMDHKQDAND